jgi:hypothetical protein
MAFFCVDDPGYQSMPGRGRFKGCGHFFRCPEIVAYHCREQSRHCQNTQYRARPAHQKAPNFIPVDTVSATAAADINPGYAFLLLRLSQRRL